MADDEQLNILRQGVEVWNHWREKNPETMVNLSKAELSGANLCEADLRWADLGWADLTNANLTGADLREAYLYEADLSWADLRDANLIRAKLSWADLSGANLYKVKLGGADLRDANLIEVNLGSADLREADLSGTYLSGAALGSADLRGVDLSGADLNSADLRGANIYEADLSWADLSGADLTGADLTGANLREAYLREADFNEADLRGVDLSGAALLGTRLNGTDLSGSTVYGISAWDLDLSEAIQKDLIITPQDQPEVTVDNLEVAQFIYLMLNNEKVRHVIDTITSKAVLILGRFTEERKQVLDALREELRQRNYLPILFDFDKPASRDLEETILTLASMSRFVIADVTDAKSIPAELRAVVPSLPSVPVRLLIQRGTSEYALLSHIKRYPWVLEAYEYDDTGQLLGSLATEVIEPAEAKVEELKQR